MTISQSSSAPLIVVIGSTGSQGGSVIQALAESDLPYRIRGLTRDTTTDVAKQLTKSGVEMVAIDTPPRKEQILEVLRGADVFFAMSQSAAKSHKDAETAEGKLYVDAAKEANIRLFIWSGLVNMTQITGGKYPNVYHFDSKAAVTAYAEEVGLPFVNVLAGLYMWNFTVSNAPKKQDDGTFVLALPVSAESVAPLLDTANDYGLFVRKAIEEDGRAREIFAHGEVISYAELVKQWSDETGKTIIFKQIAGEEMLQGMVAAGRPEHIAREYVEMFQSIAEFGYYGKKDLAPSLQGLGRKPHTWRDFVKATDWSKILA